MVLKCLVFASLGAIFVAANTVNQSPAFPVYSVREHPLLKFPQFESSSPRPVIMDRYYRYGGNRPTTANARFLPGLASYSLLGGEGTFCTGLDTLMISGGGTGPNGTFVEFTLNAAARVIVVLSGSELGSGPLQETPPQSISGLDGFSNPVSVQNNTYNRGLPGFGRRDRLASVGVAVEMEFPAGEFIKLPAPQTVSVDGRKANAFTIMFARPGTGAPVAFPTPSLPSLSAVQSIVSNVTEIDRPIPNKRCPDWLHEIHVVENDDPDAVAEHGEPEYFRTWHPIIDSVYWCYFGHGHGAYPGHFRPPFGYTAYKTPDETTSHGRQEESHRGFKVFSFPTQGGSGAVVATLHAHLSEARRFSTRFHTFMIAGFKVNGSEWTKVLELRMKLDTGGAEIPRRNGAPNGVTDADQEINNEFAKQGVQRGRKFNVINRNLTSNPAVVSSFTYEQWKGPLNTCSKQLRGRVNMGFNFDFRDPASGLADDTLDTTNENMPFFRRRFSMNQLIVISRPFGLAKSACKFEGNGTSFETGPDGIFFTDPSFKEVLPGSDRFALRQFWDPNTPAFNMPQGRAFATDVWYGHMAFSRVGAARVMRFENVESAVDPRLN